MTHPDDDVAAVVAGLAALVRDELPVAVAELRGIITPRELLRLARLIESQRNALAADLLQWRARALEWRGRGFRVHRGKLLPTRRSHEAIAHQLRPSLLGHPIAGPVGWLP